MISLKRSITILISLFLIGAIVGCASTGNSSGDSDTDVENKVTSANEFLTLEDHLRRLGGVQVRGTGGSLKITIRGRMSLSNPDQQPLFVLNERVIGRSFPQVAQLVTPEIIKSVEAIPPSRASNYGMRGGAGVIKIVTE